MNLSMRIGADGPVVAELKNGIWRLIVRGRPWEPGDGSDEVHAALRQLALDDRALAKDAFGVVINCPGSWEDEYTEEHGEAALTFEDWLERIETGWQTAVDADGRLYYF